MNPVADESNSPPASASAAVTFIANLRPDFHSEAAGTHARTGKIRHRSEWNRMLCYNHERQRPPSIF
jgi:hypothetical protein